MLFRFWRWLRPHHHRWQLHVGCALDVDPRLREFEFVVARACACGVVEEIE